MTPITSLGLLRLQENLKNYKAELVRTFDERSAAAAEGDLKENSAYIFMTERAQVLETQIQETLAKIKDSQIIKKPSQTDKIELGHLVKVVFKNDSHELSLTLVGADDNAIKPGWISGDSPLGIAILGRSVGDKVLVNDQPVEILDITVGDIE